MLADDYHRFRDYWLDELELEVCVVLHCYDLFGHMDLIFCVSGSSGPGSRGPGSGALDPVALGQEDLDQFRLFML